MPRDAPQSPITRAARPRPRAPRGALLLGGALLASCAQQAPPAPETLPLAAPPEPRGPGGFGPTEPAECGDVAFPVVLEAEDAALDGVERATQYGGFDGAGYVGGFDQIGDSVTFEVCVPTAEYYTMELRYANGSDDGAWRTLTIDGEILPGDHYFSARWSWDDWDPLVESAVFRDSALLNAGRHLITVAYEPTDAGVIALDRMTVTRGPQPSSSSIEGMLINDWQGLVAGVFGSRIFHADDIGNAPRIGELRGRANWEANNLDAATGYLRDVTSDTSWTQFDRRPLETNLFVRDDGVLEMDYVNWGETALPAAVVKEHAAVPESGVLVVRYTLTNVTDEERELDMLEYVDLSRTGRQASFDLLFPDADPVVVDGAMHVVWHEDLQAFIADLSEIHGTYVVFGAFQQADQKATGPAGGGTLAPSGSGADGPVDVSSFVTQFGAFEDLYQNDAYDGDDAEMAMLERLTLAPGQSGSMSYFYAVADSEAAAEALARTARSRPADAWITETTQAWDTWLAKRRPVEAADPELQRAYTAALVSIKHTQQPEFGSFVAATNPAYQFKVWPRDASVVAMGLDATNYLDEAEAYWRWMASVQELGENEEFPVGTWWTNYSYWLPNEGIPFVQPEWDSLGLFTIGVYRHYLLLKEERGDAPAAEFLASVWPAVRRASSFIADNIEANGFGPPDSSIWEDRFQYATFTQVTYASGLQAAYELGVVAQQSDAPDIDPAELDAWLGAARTIKAALLAEHDPLTCTGMWVPPDPDGRSDGFATGYFLRGIDPDCTADRRVDGSTDLAWVFGLLDVDLEQVRSHRQQVIERLTSNPYFQGIARFEDDTFYYTEIYSPGGIFESTVPETTWPQMSMYMAMAEQWMGFEAISNARLDWYVSTTAVQSMPPGEGVDWATQQPLVSTAVEPVTGTWFLLGLMVSEDLFDPRLTHVGPDSDL